MARAPQLDPRFEAAAHQLRKDPMFPYLAQQAQLKAAVAALKRFGLNDDELADGYYAMGVVRVAKGEPAELPTLTPEHIVLEGQSRRGPPVLPSNGDSIICDVLEAVPYTHRFLGDVLGCSRQMVSMIATGKTPERLTHKQRENLAAVLKETRRRIDEVLKTVEP